MCLMEFLTIAVCIDIVAFAVDFAFLAGNTDPAVMKLQPTTEAFSHFTSLLTIVRGATCPLGV
jgi:hypothetical protein